MRTPARIAAFSIAPAGCPAFAGASRSEEIEGSTRNLGNQLDKGTLSTDTANTASTRSSQAKKPKRARQRNKQ